MSWVGSCRAPQEAITAFSHFSGGLLSVESDDAVRYLLVGRELADRDHAPDKERPSPRT